jgi:serine/threonine protein kinase
MEEIQQESSFITYEYCCGGDLFDYVRHTKGNEKLCATIFLQILQGLSFIHAQGKTHLDIKLENVVFDGNFCAKIIDFGYMENSSNLISLNRGTPMYVPPEIMAISENMPMRYDGQKADMYSLGILLFCLYFGVGPFDYK